MANNSDITWLYTDDNGFLVSTTPADKCPLTLEEIKAKDVPSDKTVYTVNTADLPSDWHFRDAWTYDGTNFGIDMTKAREIHRTEIRFARKFKLSQLDIEFQRALETGASTTDIVAKKVALRDAPVDSAIDAASDTAALKAQWNTAILGVSPYLS
tara:strand:+ start:16284 stop:16748 length:465 start_codon:yes stop_codon:yes gene_type:complete